MHYNILRLAVALLSLITACPASSWAQQQPVRDASADSIINAQASSHNFIRASLLVVSPGNAVYSAFGHAAIRMECPSKHLDLCFTFEGAIDGWGKISFLLHKAKGGFAGVPTPLFLQQYAAEHRGITTYPLNLRPRQKQELWRVLDSEVSRGLAWEYDYPEINCVSMCIYAIRRSLLGDHIVYHDLSRVLQAPYHRLPYYISSSAPWSRLFWQVMLIDKGELTGDIEDKMSPSLLADSWSRAELSDSLGDRRPMFANAGMILLRSGPVSEPTWFTPIVALGFFVVIIVALAIIVLLRHKAVRVKSKNAFHDK